MKKRGDAFFNGNSFHFITNQKKLEMFSENLKRPWYSKINHSPSGAFIIRKTLLTAEYTGRLQLVRIITPPLYQLKCLFMSVLEIGSDTFQDDFTISESSARICKTWVSPQNTWTVLFFISVHSSGKCIQIRTSTPDWDQLYFLLLTIDFTMSPRFEVHLPLLLSLLHIPSPLQLCFFIFLFMQL